MRVGVRVPSCVRWATYQVKIESRPFYFLPKALTYQQHSQTPNLLLGFDNALFLNHKLNHAEITYFENFAFRSNRQKPTLSAVLWQYVEDWGTAMKQLKSQ